MYQPKDGGFPDAEISIKVERNVDDWSIAVHLEVQALGLSYDNWETRLRDITAQILVRVAEGLNDEDEWEK